MNAKRNKEDMQETLNFDGRVVSINGEVMTIESVDDSVKFKKNEVVYIIPSKEGIRHQRLKAEILRVHQNRADIQVFEETQGIAVGDVVEKTNALLSLDLGPGMLGMIYDGLQNPLEEIAQDHGFFLPRGVVKPAINPDKKWTFRATVRNGDVVNAGDVIGTVPEGRFTHKIFAPFDLEGTAEVDWVEEGSFKATEAICRLKLEDGAMMDLTMIQRWPVRRPIPKKMLDARTSERRFPNELLTTTGRLIDTFFPIARGGTACTPGPFGSGKTVLQHSLSKYSEVDIVIVVACGERAGEVVETIVEFPELEDPKTGGSLMDRTIIICNTSSMPVAAREASIYAGVTLGEYYRQMGYDVLLLADSTSRWAQAMRETSGRLEEIPGEEAFPAYLDSSIRGLYERCGLMRTNDDEVGALTMVGAVSPAGGNFEEPVTQSTLRTVKCFLALSSARAHKRFYPAIDPLASWSRYHEQLETWFAENVEPGWTERVKRLARLLSTGDEIQQMMQVTGEEGISMEDFITFQKALFLDMVYLQQDAFDKVDSACPLERQNESLKLVDRIINTGFDFDDKDTAKRFFNRLTSAYKNLNYSPFKSADYKKFEKEVLKLVKENCTVEDKKSVIKQVA
ncbi:MAG: V-type ATP synthase subunit A [Alphaproteobacteria bacterium]